jgi:hypothetical protein
VYDTVGHGDGQTAAESTAALAAVAATLATAGCLAAPLPAMRAALVDPALTLGSE